MDRSSTEKSARGPVQEVTGGGHQKVGLVVVAWGALALATTAITLVLRRVGSTAVPLDDAYIHFQFARGFARLEPLVYVPAAAGPPPAGEAVPGATSLLWPLLLAPFTWFDSLGSDGATWVIAGSWLLGFGALALLAHEVLVSVDRLWDGPHASRLGGSKAHALARIAAPAATLTFGGHVWCAGSGMETLPLAWTLVATARRSADWLEGRSTSKLALVALAWCAPLLRPEGLLATSMVVASLLLRRRLRLGLLAGAGAILPTVLIWAWTGSATTTTTSAKWLPLNPHHSSSELVDIIGVHITFLFSNLLNGGPWSAMVLPSGIAPLAGASLPALLFTGAFTGRFPRAALLTVVGLGMLIPTTYETFLVNRLRYLWPFAAPWLLGACLGAVWLSTAVVGVVRLEGRRAEQLHVAIAGALFGVVVGGLVSKLPRTLADLAESSDAITDQQVALGKWAAEALPQDAIIGINDAGAITYFSERTTFDVVGLTTRWEAAPWLAGPGSRFEHYERLPPARRPTHFIVYPEWLEVPDVLGRFLTSRTVASTIVGGPTMSAFEANYDSLGSGSHPVAPPFQNWRIVDEMDVADLESERHHAYVLGNIDRTDNVLERGSGWVDGGRKTRTNDEFFLLVEPGGVLVIRLLAAHATRVSVSGPSWTASVQLADMARGTEIGIELPTRERTNSPLQVEFSSPVTVLHYWSALRR